MSFPFRSCVPIDIVAMPIAVLTARGTIRTRKPVPRLHQRYPPGTPGDWIAAGHVSCAVHCVLKCCPRRDGVDIALGTLPRDHSWQRVGRAMLCTECGTPGVVNITPNWHDMGLPVPFSRDWRN